MIFFFTDFGATDIYVGQVKARLAQAAAGVPVIDLLHDAPAFRVTAAAHLLAALHGQIPAGSVVLAVVDPGVGTERRPVVVHAADTYFVGPDNGLISVLAARSVPWEAWQIVWQPQRLSRSFHGRDLFAPVAARLAAGPFPHEMLQPIARLEVMLDPQPLAQLIYVDHYGNAMSGLRASALAEDTVLAVGGHRVAHAAVFGAAAPGTAFWYCNSLGLAEIACNLDSAAARLNLAIGDPVRLITP